MKIAIHNKKPVCPVILTLTLMIFACAVQAQVTIGTFTKPVDGALLQLTEGDVTTKGLLLPRVKLTTLTALDDINPGDLLRPDPDQHIGLTVYNMPNDEICPTIDPGIYVWMGDKWMRLRGGGSDVLSKIDRNTPSGITVEKDQDGNTIVGASFGTAGIWMLHNLAVTKYADGAPIAVYDGTTRRTVASYSYPNAIAGNWGTAPDTYKRTQGLLYTWAAATGGYDPGNVDQGQYDTSGVYGSDEVESVGPDGAAPFRYVQGICPNGWHLPSDREWNILEQEVYNSPLNYSSYTSAETPFNPVWSTNWEIAMGYRGLADADRGQGAVLKELCNINYFLGLPDTNGKSLSMAENGFNGKLAGFISANNIFNYGLLGYFWTSSAYSAERAWFRYLNFNSPATGRNSEDRGDLLSVRCKKN